MRPNRVLPDVTATNQSTRYIIKFNKPFNNWPTIAYGFIWSEVIPWCASDKIYIPHDFKNNPKDRRSCVKYHTRIRIVPKYVEVVFVRIDVEPFTNSLRPVLQWKTSCTTNKADEQRQSCSISLQLTLVLSRNLTNVVFNVIEHYKTRVALSPRQKLMVPFKITSTLP